VIVPNAFLRHYEGVQQQIVNQGIAETRIGNAYGWRRNSVLSIAKRLARLYGSGSTGRVA
jgi:hypothetical protein